MAIGDLPSLTLDLSESRVKHRVGAKIPAIQPTITRSCILRDPDGAPAGLFLKELPEELSQVLAVANRELRSSRVPKTKMNRTTTVKDANGRMTSPTVLSQWSTILGSCAPKPHLGLSYARRSTVHGQPSANLFVKAMVKAGRLSMRLAEYHIPQVYRRHVEVVRESCPAKWLFADYFTSTISNCNSSAPIHRDNGNVRGAINVILVKRRNSRGGDLHVPEYGATFDQTDSSMLVYPAWRNYHAVTPIEATHRGGYRNSFIWYALKAFGNL